MSSSKDNKAKLSKLNAALAKGDGQSFLEYLREVVDTHGGMSKLAEETRLSRGTLYKTISKDGNPTLKTTIEVLRALGLRVAIKK